MMCSMAADDRKDPGTPPGGGVISNLPRHRPHHRSGKRAARPPANGAGTEAAEDQATQTSAAAEAVRETTESRPQRKPRAAGGKRGARAATGAKKTQADRSPRERIGATAGAKTRSQGGSRPAPEGPEKPGGPPNGAEVVGTVIRAAGELAEIGLNLSSEAVKNALKRLPRP
jgi:hypothetical protein